MAHRGQADRPALSSANSPVKGMTRRKRSLSSDTGRPDLAISDARTIDASEAGAGLAITSTTPPAAPFLCDSGSLDVDVALEQYQTCYNQGINTARNDATNLVCQSAYDALDRRDSIPDPFAVEQFDGKKDTPATAATGDCTNPSK